MTDLEKKTLKKEVDVCPNDISKSFCFFHFFKGHTQKVGSNSRASTSRQTASRSSSSNTSRAVPSSSTSQHNSPFTTALPSTVAPSPKLNSLAATHKLKKDIHRCHRMSRRPLPRSDPMANGFSNPGGLPSRPHVSPFSETVRILNRRVKPREVKRGRIILNLKVIDKAGQGGGALGSRNATAGRHNIPSRNRIIGKKGEAPYRPFQPPPKMLGFPMYGKPFGLQCGGQLPFHAQARSWTVPAAKDTRSTSSRYQTPPSPSSTSSSEEKSPSNASAAQSQPSTGGLSPKSRAPHPETQKCQSARGVWPTLSSDADFVALASSFLPSSPPSSLDGEREECILGRSGPSEECRNSPRLRRAKRQLPVGPGELSSSPAELKRAPAEGDPNWHPEMAPGCKDVVVTDVTTNLVTVTIKEFPSPASPSANLEDASCTPSDTTVEDPSIPKS